MKKIVLLLALLMSLSCLLMACDSTTTPEDTTIADTTAEDTRAQVTVPAVGGSTEEPTEAPTEAPSTKVTYTVIVKDQNGDVVAGAAVQMCDADTCKMPTATNAEGVATFNYDPSNYYVTVQEAPEGYTCDPEQKFYFEGDATELTVTITKN
jgi:hypothetical protein